VTWGSASRTGCHQPAGEASYGAVMDARTEELRAAHDVLAEFYADRLADALDHMPADRAVLRVRRAGRTTGLGVEFDVYWLSPEEMERRVTDAGFATVFWGGRPAEGQEGSPQGYLLARKS
jgi:hypothetical protein